MSRYAPAIINPTTPIQESVHVFYGLYSYAITRVSRDVADWSLRRTYSGV